jgi:hypothetical protein
MDQSIVRARQSESNAAVAALKTIYYLAKMNRPNYDFSDLVDFQIEQGATHLRVEGSIHRKDKWVTHPTVEESDYQY